MDAGLVTRSIRHPAAPTATFSGTGLFSAWDVVLIHASSAG